MQFLKTLNIFFKYIFRSKWIFKLPKKNKYLLVDGKYNPFIKYINKNNFSILHRRGEQLNIIILFKCILKFKFSTLDYIAEYVKAVSPKLILTAFDYHTIFYKISKKTGIKTLMLQKGKRSKAEDIIKNSRYYFPKNSKKNFYVDYFLVHNEPVKNFYSKRIRGNFYVIGSFENNFLKINLTLQKKEIVFISNYTPGARGLRKRENEDIIACNLYKLAKKNNIKFNILPRYRKNKLIIKDELKFYKKIIGKNINFILDKNQTSYELLSNYKYVFSTYSTLAIEFFAKGGRTGFIMFKSNKNPILRYRFGDFEKFTK
jgi:surface carbohydrate biosynthesis protein